MAGSVKPAKVSVYSSKLNTLLVTSAIQFGFGQVKVARNSTLLVVCAGTTSRPFFVEVRSDEVVVVSDSENGSTTFLLTPGVVTDAADGGGDTKYNFCVGVAHPCNLGTSTGNGGTAYGADRFAGTVGVVRAWGAFPKSVAAWAVVVNVWLSWCAPEYLVLVGGDVNGSSIFPLIGNPAPLFKGQDDNHACQNWLLWGILSPELELQSPSLSEFPACTNLLLSG
ncbi:hypothetical protein EDB80DRAFT_692150 [Ilyonectria destructans]|nr:hypothetical protein EDB80DRAFT_692150 [Ilyonectria destructans]